MAKDLSREDFLSQFHNTHMYHEADEGDCKHLDSATMNPHRGPAVSFHRGRFNKGGGVTGRALRIVSKKT